MGGGVGWGGGKEGTEGGGGGGGRGKGRGEGVGGGRGPMGGGWVTGGEKLDEPLFPALFLGFDSGLVLEVGGVRKGGGENSP